MIDISQFNRQISAPLTMWGFTNMEKRIATEPIAIKEILPLWYETRFGTKPKGNIELKEKLKTYNQHNAIHTKI